MDLQCNICYRTFTSICYLKQHKRAHEHKAVVAKSNVCHICGKNFNRADHLRIHISDVHGKLKPNKCNFCGKRFAQKGVMVRHKNTVHSNAKPYACNFCNKAYNFKGTLTKHVKYVHQGIKDFSCDICDERFKVNSELLYHQEAAHNGNQSFDCPICGKGFARKGSLSNHIMFTHKNSQLKKSQCDICGKILTNHGMQLHKKAVHDRLKLFPCNICNVTFTYKQVLKNHQMTTHGNQQKSS